MTTLAGVLILSLAYAIPSFAQPLLWDSRGVMIRQGYHIEWQRVGIRCSNGDILYAWSDTRLGDRDVRAQRVSATGTVLWQDGGIPIVIAPSRQEDPEIIEVTGGYIIAWIDFREDTTGDVWAQKIDQNGNRLWASDGVLVNRYPYFVEETTLRAAHDGSGGAIIAWVDGRGGDAGDILAQRILSNGTVDPSWPEDGLEVGVGSGSQVQVTATSDNAGGMIIAWQDGRNNQPDIYISRILPNGSTPWGENGMPICTVAAEQKTPKVDVDGYGGAFVVWVDSRNGPSDIYYQHVNGNGDILLEQNGLPMCTASNNQNEVRIVYDGYYGAICVWDDYRAGGVELDIYAQKILPDGSLAWTVNGELVCGAPFGQEEVRLTSDLRGGAIIAWEDTRQSNGNRLMADIYAQRLDASGTARWAANGIMVIDSINMQTQPMVRPDGVGGALIAWSDSRNGSIGVRIQRMDSLGAKKLTGGGVELVWGLDGDAIRPLAVPLDLGRVACIWQDSRLGVRGPALYFQILDSTGQINLTTNGIPVAGDIPLDVPANQQNHQVCPDGTDGFFAIWEDQRTGTTLIRAQRVNRLGQALWPQTGILVVESDHDQDEAACAPAGDGGLFVAWSGRDTNSQIDIYVQRLSGTGNPIWAQPLQLQSTYDDDILQGMIAGGTGRAILVWESGGGEETDIYSLCVNADGSTAWSVAICDCTSEQRTPSMVSDGHGGALYAWRDYRNLANNDIYAQSVDSLGNFHWAPGGLAVCTAANDQVSPRSAVDKDGNFLITWEDYRNGADRDLYVQKISPTGVLQFPVIGLPVSMETSDQYEARILAEHEDGFYMVWTDIRSRLYPDIYAMHMNASGGIAVPVEWPQGGLMVNASENLQHRSTIAPDAGGGVITFWQDWRSSGKAPLINLWAQRLNDGTVDVPLRTGPALPEGYALQAFPNPFNSTTEIRFSLPRNERVRMAIYNVLGQMVTTLVDEPLLAGSYRMRWNASDAASGVYFCRIEAARFNRTIKMMMVK
jgi:hypothetical protein